MFLVRHMYRRLLSYLVGALLIGVAIGSHETAHWLAARACGIYCPSLNIGVGPGITVGNVDETKIILRALPWGGWASVASGPSEVGPESTTKRSFAEQPKAERILVSFAGIAMNGVTYLGLLIWRGRQRPTERSNVQRDEAIAWAHSETESDFRNVVLQRLADGPASALQFLSRGAMFGLWAIREDLIRVCSGLAVINLIPIPPLDGLKILQALTREQVSAASVNATSAGSTSVAPSVTPTGTTVVVSLESLALLAVLAYVLLGVVPALIRTARFEWRLYKRFAQIPRT